MPEDIRKNFSSDNVVRVCPEVMQALMEANDGSASAYGNDAYTSALDARFGEVFESEVAVFPIVTGTASNSLALSALVSPFGSVVCDESAHIQNDEGGAPEFFMHGAKIVTIPSGNGLMQPSALSHTINEKKAAGLLAPPIQALSLTQASEWGLVYQTDHLTSLSKVAHAEKLTVHLDGARLGNAIASLGCTPAETTWKAGVDVLTFGGTKNGAMAAEAVVFFLNDRTRPFVENFKRRIKRSGHLWSKHRFLSAQLLALLKNNLWLRNAQHANIMAQRLSTGLQALPNATLPYATQSNEIFIALPEHLVQKLEKGGFGFYRWPTPAGVDGTMIRLVTSFDTREKDVDALLDYIAT
ncbi:low-specificity threonine aldolase [Neokomagataea thailandica NBRC 106555]|uniref:L-threonine aldolase n=1 Tax=Neokomagataea thailandica NBRC 106555 TaxID=1223520 RepID=A0ABQ0QMV9_9PROT|nr:MULTISPECIES: low specificity L-threonine aldolase [Neokomagataea]GBR50801.1 low-specificity threonine aldolase [Neokomagataea thailandica NBRC 106555]